MDPRLVEFYDQELKYLRETAREFGNAYPTLASRLGVNAPGEADPYVERLLEGVAFLAARVQLKLSDEFPKFTQHLIDAVYPHYLAPTPSVAVLAFHPKPDDPMLEEGAHVARGTLCRIAAAEPNRSDCVFSTAQAVRVWPIRVAKVEYLSGRSAVAAAAGESGLTGEGGVLIRLENTGAAPFSALPIDDLTFYLGGAESLSGRIYEQIIGHGCGVAMSSPGRRGGAERVGQADVIDTPAFDDDAALLPLDRRSFRGYRIVQEFFACPERFQFVRISGLREAFSRAEGRTVDLVLVTATSDRRLAGALSEGSFRLFCTPAINLFEKRCDPVLLDRGDHEFRVVPERTRPLDYEIYRLLEVTADTGHAARKLPFFPIYQADPRVKGAGEMAFYTTRRLPTRLSTLYPTTRASDYTGTDLWIAPSDLPAGRGQPDQLSVRALCTNRDIADTLRSSGAQLAFTLSDSSFVESVTAVLRPTRPRLPLGFEDSQVLDGARSHGDRLWRVVSHLRPNYESLFADEASAARLREHLALYVRLENPSDMQQVDAITELRETSAIRRISSSDPLAFARGRRIDLTLDERSFPEGGAFLFAQVVDRFLAEFASVNAFIETHVSTSQRGRIASWGPRRGERPTI